MLRVTLGGSNINTIPDNQESGYVKLIFPNGDSKPLLRTYTIRNQRTDEIDIDFMLHQDGGPACTWAQQVKENDVITVGGPGPRKMIEQSADWYLLIGDMTALPAISVNLAELPDDAKGYAVIEVVSADDIQDIKHPEGLLIKWVINAHPGQNPNNLLDHVKSLAWLTGQVSAWAACEFGSMKLLRHFLKQEKAISNDHLYISSYWKLGSNEDQHKVEKRDDAEKEVA
jgi:NADPH-dependent ferric siderophore reductase